MIEYRPWGSYEIIAEGDGYKVKRITVSPGGELSLQYHNHRREFWTVVSGSGTIHVDGTDIAACAPAAFDISPRIVHRAGSDEGMVFIEVQYGEILSEEDIVRLKDKYNRDSFE